MFPASKCLKVGAQVVAVGAVYYAGAFAGLRLALVGSQVTPLWPPTGIAVSALLLLGIRVWPGISLGALAVNLPLGPSLPAVMLISVGNTLAPVCAWLLLTAVGFRADLERLKDALALVFLGAFAGMLVSATFGSVALTIAGDVPTAHVWATWSVWWVGDAMGVLLVAPLILMVSKVRSREWAGPGRAAEWFALVGGAFVVTAFGMNTPSHLFFLPFLFVIWGALRFHQAGAIPAALAASIVATLAAARGWPSFAQLDLTWKMILLQVFNGSLALTALIHAAIIAERDNARRDVEAACVRLSEAVTVLGEGLATRGRTLEVTRRFRRDLER